MNPRHFSTELFLVFVLALILAAFVLAGPVTGIISPYKKVGREYILHPNIDEKVQFDGVYTSRTTWGNGDILYYVPPDNYDVIYVDGESVFLKDPYYSNNLSGKIGCRVHVEGVFTDSEATVQPTKEGPVAGHIFEADKIEVL